GLFDIGITGQRRFEYFTYHHRRHRLAVELVSEVIADCRSKRRVIENRSVIKTCQHRLTRAGLSRFVANQLPDIADRRRLQAISINHSSLAQTVCEVRSEEHTSELQSRENLVCRL